MNKFEVSPDYGSYSMVFAPTGFASSVGINNRYSDEVPNKWHTVYAVWTVSKKEYNYIVQAVRAHEQSGHAPFLIDLIGYNGDLQEFVATIRPGSFNFNSVSGETFKVSATLEVEQLQ